MPRFSGSVCLDRLPGQVPGLAYQLGPSSSAGNMTPWAWIRSSSSMITWTRWLSSRTRVSAKIEASRSPREPSIVIRIQTRLRNYCVSSLRLPFFSLQADAAPFMGLRDALFGERGFERGAQFAHAGPRRSPSGLLFRRLAAQRILPGPHNVLSVVECVRRNRSRDPLRSPVPAVGIVSGTVVEDGQIEGHSPDANRSSSNEVWNRLRLLRGLS
jgi:hypothetical protein